MKASLVHSGPGTPPPSQCRYLIVNSAPSSHLNLPVTGQKKIGLGQEAFKIGLLLTCPIISYSSTVTIEISV